MIVTFEEGLIAVLMDPDRLRRERVQTEAEVASHELQHDVERAPFVQPVHHEYGEARH